VSYYEIIVRMKEDVLKSSRALTCIFYVHELRRQKLVTLIPRSGAATSPLPLFDGMYKQQAVLKTTRTVVRRISLGLLLLLAKTNIGRSIVSPMHATKSYGGLEVKIHIPISALRGM
jgi:hypothetical protein